MSCLFITADEIGIPTGGGIVTQHESQALFNYAATFSENAVVWQRTNLSTYSHHTDQDPWQWDERALRKLQTDSDFKPKLAHFYSGTFSKTASELKERGCKVSYTIAAHDRAISKREHKRWGMDFPYRHLTEESLWKQYIEGYRLADVIICPSTVAKKTVQEYGPEFANKQIEVIPHGCEIPETVKSLPKDFVLGYMGAVSPDKGTIYLLQAWKKLAYKGATLILAGRDSEQPWVMGLVHRYGGGNIVLAGWQRNPSDFFNQIGLYVQPTATEGFGLEVLEAMAHGRMALCSEGAGAVDIALKSYSFRSCSIDELANKIDWIKNSDSKRLVHNGEICRQVASELTWNKVRQKYIDIWRSML